MMLTKALGLAAAVVWMVLVALLGASVFSRAVVCPTEPAQLCTRTGKSGLLNSANRPPG